MTRGDVRSFVVQVRLGAQEEAEEVEISIRVVLDSSVYHFSFTPNWPQDGRASQLEDAMTVIRTCGSMPPAGSSGAQCLALWQCKVSSRSKTEVQMATDAML